MVKPGITGLAQITLGYDDSLESVVRKTHLDLTYQASLLSLKSWIRMEMWVLANTFKYLLNRKPLSEFVTSLPSQNNSQPLLESRGLRVHKSTPITQIKFIPPENPVQHFLTVDVECWFHAHNLSIPKSEWNEKSSRVENNVRRILDLLLVQKTKATFFVLGWVADRYPEVVRMIDAGGHEIGTHGYHHDKITDLSPYQFEKDLEMSLNSLAKITNQKIVGHRASNFSVVESTLWALEILERHGITYDSSIFPVARKRYGIGNYPNPMPHTINLERGRSIREIPLSTLNMGGKGLPMSGGGYLRLYPYFVTERFLQHRTRQGLPAMVYFHPWELDAAQDRMNVGMIKSFQHYVNLSTTEWKIDRLVNQFEFTSIQEALETSKIKRLLKTNPVQIRKTNFYVENTRPVSMPDFSRDLTLA